MRMQHASPGPSPRPDGPGPDALRPIAVVCPLVSSLFLPRTQLAIRAPYPGTPVKRYYSHAKRRAQILAAARSLLAEDGCDNVRIRQLAKRSGVSPPTIYNIVGVRNDVLREAIREALCGKLSLAREIAVAEGISPILAYTDLSWCSIANDPGYYREVTRAAFKPDLDPHLVAEIHGDLLAAFSRWLNEMAAAGQLRENRISLAAAANTLTLHNSATITRWMRGDFDLQQMRAELIVGAGLILLGLATKTEIETIENWIESSISGTVPDGGQKHS